MTHARIGEIVVSRNPDDELVALGLGSCIGVVMIDEKAQVAGLAHVMLPTAHADQIHKGKYADTAVPELLRRIVAIGGSRDRLRVAIAGGAAMFGEGGQLEIGARNAAAVRAAIGATGLRCHAADTGGTQGRTVRISLKDGSATVRVAGGSAVELLRGSPGEPTADAPSIARSRPRASTSPAVGAIKRAHAHDPASHIERAMTLRRNSTPTT